MIKNILSLFIVVFFAGVLNAQKVENGDNLSTKSESIGAVPDLPAFKALGTEPSNLLRPSDVKALATDLSSFIEGGRFVIPRGIAIEVSPGALIYRDRIISIEDYKKRNVNLAYNTGISLGTQVNDQGISKIAIGWRTTLINEADKFLDKNHRDKINNILKEDADYGNDWEKFKTKNKDRFSVKEDNLEDLKLQDAKKSEDSALYNEFNALGSLSRAKSTVDALDLQFEKTHWNARRLDLAAALVMTSEDSFGKNLKADRINVWLSGSEKIKNYGQFSWGIYGTAGFDKKKIDSSGKVIYPAFQLTGTGRIYAGTNKYKFFTEFQAGAQQDTARSVYFTNHISIGTEIGIYNLAWINIYGGIKDIAVTRDNKSITSGFFRFDIKLTLPDWVKLRNKDEPPSPQ